MGPTPAPQPVQIDLDRSRELRIRWSDGATTVISLVELRRNCPCAGCRAEREELQRNPLAVLPGGGTTADKITARDLELVGHYAIRVIWRDGHETGIYDFRLLRSLGQPAAGTS